MDPAGGTVLSSVTVGSLPKRLALSKDGTRLYTALEGANAVQPIDAASQTLLPRFFVGYNAFGFSVPVDLTVDPTNAHTIAVAREDVVTTTPGRDAVLFDDGIPRPVTSKNPVFYLDVGCNQLDYTETGQTVLCLNNDIGSFLMEPLAVLPTGFGFPASFPSQLQSFYASMRYLGGRAYFSEGTILDITTHQSIGRITLPQAFGLNISSGVLPVPTENRIYYLNGANGEIQVLSYDLTALTLVGSVTLPADGPATALVSCGVNCLAVAGSTKIFFVDKSLVGTPVCNYTIDAGGHAFDAGAGEGSITITVNSACSWTATGAPDWVTFTSSSAGSGGGVVNYQIAANSGGARSGTIMIGDQSYRIEQEASSIAGLSLIGSIPHVAAQENWTTTFTLVNKSAAAVQARFSLFDESGTSLELPLVFPQQPFNTSPLLGASLDRTLLANASLMIGTAGPTTPPVQIGSAQLAATGAVDGFAIFHQNVTTQEAVVPLEVRNANSYLLAFDNTNGLVLGVAVENVSAQNAVIPVIIRDDTGAIISAAGTTISLGGHGHTSFVLSDPALGFSVTANKRGTIEFDTPAAGQISVLGLRFTPPNSALTTIPALANIGTGGGSIAHLASGGDGWQTTFVLVNAGTTAAPATLSFFADQTGLPQALPLTFPQGNIAATTAPSVTQTLAPGASLIIESSGAPQLITGSAQLSTTGHISGFVIFRHNGQEAVVPLESRNANAFIVAFDNTNGTATGVAMNAVSAGQITIPVTVRDDTGTIIATDAIALAANGHSPSPWLPTNIRPL